MPFKIQRQPVGLNRLLSIFGGQSPTELEDRTRLFVDATENYGSSTLVVTNDQFGAGAIGRTMVGTASNPGRLFNMSALVNIGAAPGTFVRITLLFSPASGFQSVVLGTMNFNGAGLVAGAGILVGPTILPKPLVFAPGATFTVITQGDAAGADHVVFGRHLFENYA